MIAVRGLPCETCGLRSLLDSLVGVDSRCPHWLNAAAGIVETNTITQETRLLEGCSIIENYRLMGAVINASNRPAAAIESLRNETVQALGRIEGGVPQAVVSTLMGLVSQRLPQPQPQPNDDTPLLGNGAGEETPQ